MKRNYLLLTPGPLSTSETVREAMLQDWCTWDKDYNEGIVTPLRKDLLAIAGLNEDEYTNVLLQGSGTYCVEATIGAAVRPEDKLLILANGAYGKRMAEIARYYHIDYVLVSLNETELITGETARKALEENPGVTHLSMVHSETTTGLLNRIEEVAEVIKGKNITFIVDAMSSFGGVPIDIKGLGIDFLISSANKCIQGVPGFGFIIAKKEKMSATKGNAHSLSLDIYAQWETMEKGNGKWRYTSPTHAFPHGIAVTKKITARWSTVCAISDLKRSYPMTSRVVSSPHSTIRQKISISSISTTNSKQKVLLSIREKFPKPIRSASEISEIFIRKTSKPFCKPSKKYATNIFLYIENRKAQT